MSGDGATFERAARGQAVGMADSEANSGEAWAAYADGFIERFLRGHETMHVDDLWEAGLQMPISPRALGARMQTAARRGLMVRVGSRPSVRSHLSHKPVWRSLVYEPVLTLRAHRLALQRLYMAAYAQWHDAMDVHDDAARVAASARLRMLEATLHLTPAKALPPGYGVDILKARAERSEEAVWRRLPMDLTALL